MNPESRPRLGVLYDEGSAGPAEIAAAARSCRAELFLVVDEESSHVRELMPILRRRFELCDISGLSAAAAAEAIARLRLDALMTVSEHCLLRTAQLAAAAEVPGWHSPQTALALTDKYLQRRVLAQAGADTTACMVVTHASGIRHAIASVGLPAVLKPRSGMGSRFVRRADTAEEAEAAAAEYFGSGDCHAPLLAECLHVGVRGGTSEPWGDYVSVETAVHDGQCHHICVSGKFPLAEPFRERGSFVPHALDDRGAAAVTAVAAAAIGALGVRRGMVHTELKLTERGPRVIEVNGRLGGPVADLLRRGAACDVIADAMRLALGQPAATKPVFNQVTYQYTLVPPMHSRRLLSLQGIDLLKSLPGVDFVDVRAVPGQALDWRAGDAARLGRVHGQVADHKELARLIAEIEAAYEGTYAYSEGENC